MRRREFLRSSVGASGALAFPAILRAQDAAPAVTSGVQFGDVQNGRAVVWAQASRPAQMLVEWATNERFDDSKFAAPDFALNANGLCAKVLLAELPPGQTIFARTRFKDPASRAVSDPIVGHFRTAGDASRAVSFLWGADTVGQGYGISAAMGGMKAYDAMAKADADVFIHVGDTVYADQPLPAEVKAGDGTTYRNTIITEAKSKVAESLAEFRGQWAYNLLDDNVRRFNSGIAQFVLWDDHEVRNNWYPGQFLDDPRYQNERRVDVLAARARRAFVESTPILGLDPSTVRIDRTLNYGPLLDVFALDMRSFRGPNGANRETVQDTTSAILGVGQLASLKRSLKASRAVWKVIASDMPLGLVVGDGPGRFEAVANAEDGPPLGRELEIADLLRFIKRERIANTVWVTGDVHYAAAHRYSPDDAAFTDFEPFWEFIAGPLHAGTFPRNAFDKTFGPSLKFSAIPSNMAPNQPPSAGFQFFGRGEIDPETQELSVSLHNITGRKLWSVTLPPAPPLA